MRTILIMKILLIEDKDEWNSFIAQHATPDGGFLQSWQWGEFQKSYGRQIFRVVLIENDEIICGWQIIEMNLPLGMKYWYGPRVITQSAKLKAQNQSLKLKTFISEIIKIAEKEKAIFIRVDAGDDSLKDFGFIKTKLSIQPQEELILDITKPIEQLLAEMKPKARYNIKVAEKHNIKIFNFSPYGGSPAGGQLPIFKDGLSSFLGLVEKTSARQGIKAHPKDYYKKMIEILSQDKTAILYAAKHENKIIAANLMTYFNGVATYLHGGSDDDYKNLMAPYLLHWQAILDAKNKGFNYYNFGGVSEQKPNWQGITRFKTGFAPQTFFTKYGGVWDLPVEKIKYSIYKILKAISHKL